jgi:PAS domain S-box-containing protein
MNIPLQAVIFILAIGSALFITTIAFRRRGTAGAISLFVFGIALAVWASIFTFFSHSHFWEDIYWKGVTQIFAAITATAIFTFVLEYSNKSSWLNKRNIALLTVEPAIILLVFITNARNKVFFANGSPVNSTAAVQSDPWLWINSIYFNLITLIGIYILIKTFARSPLPYRLQSGIVLVGSIFIIPASLVSLTVSNPIYISIILMSAFTIAGIIFTYGLLSYQVLDIVPIPRDIIVERMDDGWMVLDMQNRIVDLNPAAEAVIGLPRERIFGLPAENVLTDWPNLINRNESSKELDIRGSVNLQNIWRYLNLRVSPLMDLQGHQFGRLVVWRDITDFKKVEEARQLARDEMFMLLHSISGAASQAANIEEFLEDTIYQIVYFFKSQASAIFLFEENIHISEQRRLALISHHGLSPEFIQKLSSLSEKDELVETILKSNGPTLIKNMQNNPAVSETMRLSGFHSMLLMPIAVQGQKLGVIGLARNETPTYSPDEIARLNVVADEIASFIHCDRQRQLSIALAERQRLVRDLHDSTTQKLYGLLTLTEAAQAGLEAGSPEQLGKILSRIGENARQALKEMRLFLYELQPVDLERDGLVSILNQRLTAVEGRADVKARLLSDETVSLPLDKEVALYFIAQEALNNVLKHAKAKSVTVRLKQTKANVKLEIEDDGNGFIPRKADEGGMGMRNMKERASQVGGKLRISSIPGKGTKISATVSKDRQSRIHLSGYSS